VTLQEPKDVFVGLYNCVQVFLSASYAYYCLDRGDLMSDPDFDEMCAMMKRNWDIIEHRHKYLIDLEGLSAGTGYCIEEREYPGITKSSTHWRLNHGVKFYLKGKNLNMNYDLIQDEIGAYYKRADGWITDHFAPEKALMVIPQELDYHAPRELSYAEIERAKNRIRRQRWLMKPENRKKDAEASLARKRQAANPQEPPEQDVMALLGLSPPKAGSE